MSTEKETFTTTCGDWTKEYIAYPNAGELVTIARELFHGNGEDEIVAESRHACDLADDGETVVHAGIPWREYAEKRHKRLVECRGFDDE